jgi:hypothetical protein
MRGTDALSRNISAGLIDNVRRKELIGKPGRSHSDLAMDLSSQLTILKDIFIDSGCQTLGTSVVPVNIGNQYFLDKNGTRKNYALRRVLIVAD